MNRNQMSRDMLLKTIEALRRCENDTCVCDECVCSDDNVKKWRALMGISADMLEKLIAENSQLSSALDDAVKTAQELKEELHRKHNQVIDFMEKEEFAILNAIPTAEATIEIILKNTKKILQNSNCFIMGFGRIGKVLADRLKGLSAKVTCMITNEVERAWAIAYGYETISNGAM